MPYQTSTITKTRTVTYTDVRYVISKVKSDMFQLRFFHGCFSKQYEEDMGHDLFQWVYSGYAERIKVLFFNPSLFVVRFEIKYDIERGTVVSTDEDAGSIPFKDLSGCSFRILVTTNDDWKNLSPEEKKEFYDRLILQWGKSSLEPVYEGGSWTSDRTYSKNSLAAHRSIYTT